MNPSKPQHWYRSEGERADFPGLGNRYIIGSDQTDGRFALLEHTIPPRGPRRADAHARSTRTSTPTCSTGLWGAMIGDEVARGRTRRDHVRATRDPALFLERRATRRCGCWS